MLKELYRHMNVENVSLRANIDVGRMGDRLIGMGNEMNELDFDMLSTPLPIEPFSFSWPLNSNIYIYI